MTLPWDSALDELEKLREVLEVSEWSPQIEIRPVTCVRYDILDSLKSCVNCVQLRLRLSSSKAARHYSFAACRGWRARLDNRRLAREEVIAEIRKLNAEWREG